MKKENVHMEGLVKLAGSEPLKKAKVQNKNSDKVFKYLKQNYPKECVLWSTHVDWELKDVSLANIKMARRPGGAREMDKVKGIAGAVKDGKPMEPVVLVKLPDGAIKIADGYHRTLGFDHAGKKKIKAWIANVPDNKGPWDKEMHEKKLNVGKKANEYGLVGLMKIAIDDEEDPNKLVGIGAIGSGALIAQKQLPRAKEKITGMEQFYHGTGDLDSIQKEGLRGTDVKKGTSSHSVHQTLGVPLEELENKVYLTRNRNYAKLYANEKGTNDVANVKIPYEELRTGVLKETPNPELHGATSKEEFLDKRMHILASQSSPENPEIALQLAKKRFEEPFVKKSHESLYKEVSAPNTLTLLGDLPSRYVKGAEDFQNQTLKGFGGYLKNNPARFSQGLATAAVGPGLSLGGLAYLANNQNE